MYVRFKPSTWEELADTVPPCRTLPPGNVHNWRQYRRGRYEYYALQPNCQSERLRMCTGTLDEITTLLASLQKATEIESNWRCYRNYIVKHCSLLFIVRQRHTEVGTIVKTGTKTCKPVMLGISRVLDSSFSFESFVDVVNDGMVMKKHLMTILEGLVAVFDQLSRGTTSTSATDQLKCCRFCVDKAQSTSECPHSRNPLTFIRMRNRISTTNRVDVRAMDLVQDA